MAEALGVAHKAGGRYWEAELYRLNGVLLLHQHPLASAYAWRGQQAEAATAVAEILKLRQGYTVQQLTEEGLGFSDNPTFRQEYQRIVEGARQAGLPEI
jgi:hypothetical protein